MSPAPFDVMDFHGSFWKRNLSWHGDMSQTVNLDLPKSWWPLINFYIEYLKGLGWLGSPFEALMLKLEGIHHPWLLTSHPPSFVASYHHPESSCHLPELNWRWVGTKTLLHFKNMKKTTKEGNWQLGHEQMLGEAGRLYVVFLIASPESSCYFPLNILL